MPRRKTKKKGDGEQIAEQVAVRLDPDLMRELDEFADSISRPGMQVSRATAARVLLIEGIDRFKGRSK